MFTALRPQDRFTKPTCGMRVDIHHAGAPYSCWLFNEGAGTLVNDAVLGKSSAANFSSLNFPTWVGGDTPDGPALRFASASSQFIDLGLDVSDVGFPNENPWGQGALQLVASNNKPCTLAIRCRTTVAGTAGYTLYSEFQNSGTVGFLQVLVSAGSVGRLTVQARDDAATLIQIPISATGITDGAWHTVHVVNQGSGRSLLLFKDGMQIGSAANTLTNAMHLDRSRAGSNVGVAGSQFFEGDIGFIMTFARALSPAEVAIHSKLPYGMFLPYLPRQTSLLPPTMVIDRRTANFRPASRIARGGQ